MRTTFTLEDDLVAAIEQDRRTHGGTFNEAVNRLIRSGLRQRRTNGELFVQESQAIGLTIEVVNVADALELLEGPAHR